MKETTPVELSEVQAREASANANVRIGRYHMDEHCPNEEFVFLPVKSWWKVVVWCHRRPEAGPQGEER